MKTVHFTEPELQLFADNPERMGPLHREHLNSCQHCRLSMENYSAISTSLRNMQCPEFSFDLAELVIAGLPVKEKPFAGIPAIAALLGVAVMIIVVIVYGQPLILLFAGMPMSLLYLMLLPAIVLTVLQGMLIVNEYQRKVNLLANL